MSADFENTLEITANTMNYKKMPDICSFFFTINYCFVVFILTIKGPFQIVGFHINSPINNNKITQVRVLYNLIFM